MLEAIRAWVRAFHAALLPYASAVGAYVNGFTDQKDEDFQRAYGTDKFDRLARIKAEYDPHNLFRRNANVKPSVRAPAQRSDAPGATAPVMLTTGLLVIEVPRSACRLLGAPWI